MRFTYCPDCGEKLIEKEIGDEGFMPYCHKCEKPHFDTFPVAVIALVYDENNDVLLLRQSYISTQYHNLVSGYMKVGESAEQTVVREIKEEVGLDVEELALEGTHWFGKKQMLMVGFFAKVKRATPILSQEVDEAKWVKAVDAPDFVHPIGNGSVSAILTRKFLQSIQ